MPITSSPTSSATADGCGERPPPLSSPRPCPEPPDPRPAHAPQPPSASGCPVYGPVGCRVPPLPSPRSLPPPRHHEPPRPRASTSSAAGSPDTARAVAGRPPPSPSRLPARSLATPPVGPHHPGRPRALALAPCPSTSWGCVVATGLTPLPRGREQEDATSPHSSRPTSLL